MSHIQHSLANEFVPQQITNIRKFQIKLIQLLKSTNKAIFQTNTLIEFLVRFYGYKLVVFTGTSLARVLCLLAYCLVLGLYMHASSTRLLSHGNSPVHLNGPLYSSVVLNYNPMRKCSCTVPLQVWNHARCCAAN